MAVTAATARRRLRALLSDEDYGPKLARLSQRDARPILDMLESSSLKDVRQAIVNADSNRRARVRTPSTRSQLSLTAIAQRNAKLLGAKPAVVIANYSRPDGVAPLTEVSTMDSDTLRMWAREQSFANLPARFQAWIGATDANPFWYHSSNESFSENESDDDTNV